MGEKGFEERMILGNLPRIKCGKRNRDYSSNCDFRESMAKRPKKGTCYFWHMAIFVVDLGKFVVRWHDLPLCKVDFYYTNQECSSQTWLWFGARVTRFQPRSG